MLAYLSNLEKNNNREWYHNHKKELGLAQSDFDSFIQDLLFRIGTFEPSVLDYTPKSLMFRMARDVRFSKDKTPYNASFRAHMGPAGKIFIPVGYYISINPEHTFIGGGLFSPQISQATTMVRDYIVEHGETFEKIISNPSFSDKYVVKGDQLKRNPKGYDSEHPQINYLKHKSWYVEHAVETRLLDSYDGFLDFLTEYYKAMKPFNDFLNTALSGFVMPEKNR